MEQIQVFSNAWEWSNVLRALILAVAGFFMARLGAKLACHLTTPAVVSVPRRSTG